MKEISIIVGLTVACLFGIIGLAVWDDHTRRIDRMECLERNSAVHEVSEAMLICGALK